MPFPSLYISNGFLTVEHKPFAERKGIMGCSLKKNMYSKLDIENATIPLAPHYIFMWHDMFIQLTHEALSTRNEAPYC